jgi:polyhydroxybutyrate depolymerase
MRKLALLVTATIVVLGLTGFACLKAVNAADNPPRVLRSVPLVARPVATSTKTYSMTVGSLKRSYQLTAPAKPPASAPVIIALSGLGATVAQETTRDLFIPYAQFDMAEVVYPVAIKESWNAIGCCDYASAHHVDDLGFLKALVAKVDPGHKRKVYVVGYSNGARLVYRVACTDPALFDGYAAVKGGPMSDCVVKKPANILQVASLDDPEVAYKPGEKGREPLPVTTELSRLKAAEKCPATAKVTHSGTMTYSVWNGCAGNSRVALAVWQDGKHSFPRPPASKPAAAQVIWAFFTKTALAPLPA